MAAGSTHRALLLSAQRAASAADLAWLRKTEVDPALRAQVRTLLSERGWESLADAVSGGGYAADELPLVARQLGHLAVRAELAKVRPRLALLMAARVPIQHGSETLIRLVEQLFGSAAIPHAQGSLTTHDYALSAQLDGEAHDWTACRSRAKRTLGEHTAKARRMCRLDRGPDVQSAPTTSIILTDVAAPAVEPPAPSVIASGHVLATEPASTREPEHERVSDAANAWLSATDDAFEDMSRWLMRQGGAAGADTWSARFRALRAPQFDGLARPVRRLVRLAESARRLGFARELTSNMHAEHANACLVPCSRVLALSVPDDVRVFESRSEFGVLSDLAAARAIGEGLACALVSPAQSDVLRMACGLGVSAAIGGLFLQLRADPRFLGRVEGHAPDVSERLARHAAIVVLALSRLHAALAWAEEQTVPTESERLEVMCAVVERALGCRLPPGVTAIAYLASAVDGADFTALDAGLALHAALRERFDEDWYLNPRVSDVLRGACTRGSLLSIGDFRTELAAHAALGASRLLELIE